jgi:hypothetical protein
MFQAKQFIAFNQVLASPMIFRLRQSGELTHAAERGFGIGVNRILRGIGGSAFEPAL